MSDQVGRTSVWPGGIRLVDGGMWCTRTGRRPVVVVVAGEFVEEALELGSTLTQIDERALR